MSILNKLTNYFSGNIDKAKADELATKSSAVKIDEGWKGTIQTGAFEGNSNLVSINTKDITVIEDEAFKNCSQLEILSMPNIEQIGENAFENCTNLCKVSTKDENTAETVIQKLRECGLKQKIELYIEEQLIISIKDDCAYLPKDRIYKLVTGNEFTVPNYYFTGDLKNVIISGAFKDMSKLTKLDTNATVIVEDYAFKNCSNLKEIYLLNVKEIGDEVFKGCTNLKYVNVSEDMVSKIKESLQKAYLRQQVYIRVNDIIVDWLHNELSDFIICRDSEDFDHELIEIPNYYTKINDDLFSEMHMTEINTNKVTIIGNNVLKYCSKLENVYLPNVEKIGDNFCIGCPKLKKITVKDEPIAKAIYSMISQYINIEHDIDIYIEGGNEPILGIKKKMIIDEFVPSNEKALLIFNTVCSKLDIDQNEVKKFAKTIENVEPDSLSIKTIMSTFKLLFASVSLNKSEEEIKLMIAEALSEIDG